MPPHAAAIASDKLAPQELRSLHGHGDTAGSIEAGLLQEDSADSSSPFEDVILGPTESPTSQRRAALWWTLGILIAGCLVVAVAYLFPWLATHVIVPTLTWVDASLPKPVIAVMIVVGMATFPLFILPSSGWMWLCGVVFRYFPGFIILTLGSVFGMSLPFLVGRRFFGERVRKYIFKYKRIAFLMESAERNHPFKWVLLVRLADMPYFIVNYGFSATTIPFRTYLLASVLGQSPHNFAGLYIGITLKNLAEASHHQRHLNPVEVAELIVGGFCVLALVVGGSVWAHHEIRKMESQEMEELELEAADGTAGAEAGEGHNMVAVTGPVSGVEDGEDVSGHANGDVEDCAGAVDGGASDSAGAGAAAAGGKGGVDKERRRERDAAALEPLVV